MLENENTTNTQSSDLSKSNRQFADYHKRPTKRRTKEEILAKYFVPRNEKEVFRVLPPKAGKKPIEEAFFHVLTTNIAGAKKKHGTIIYCPAHNDPKVKKLDKDGHVALDGNDNPTMIPAPCPCCKKAKDMLAEQDSSVKGNVKKENLTDAQQKIFDKNKEIFIEANKWQAKKFYILRGIDRNRQGDSVKFWRFKHNFRGDGVFNKLLPVLEEFNVLNQVDFTDKNNGTDLSVSTAEANFNNRNYRMVSAIIPRGKSPLSTDPQQLQMWLNDNITWREVFLPKKTPIITSYQFLEMIVAGINPYWEDSDANNKHWVFPNNPELEARANTRTQNLDADVEENFEYASDLADFDEYASTPVANATPVNVTTQVNNTESVNNIDVEAVNVSEPNKNQVGTEVHNDYDELPF
jgi:hypothetical protein